LKHSGSGAEKKGGQIPESELPVLPLGGVARKVAIEASAGAATIAATYRDRFWI
jgi:hypothetical protein